MYHSNMLSPEELALIPRSTRSRWDNFKHENCFGAEIAEIYIQQFDKIKHVYSRKQLYNTVRLLCEMSDGYHTILDGLDSKYKVLRENANEFTGAIKKISQKTGRPIKTVLKLFGVNKDWYYRNRPEKGCKVSPIAKCYREHPYQLTLEEVGKIEKFLTSPINRFKAKTSIYYDMMRKGVLYCSISTFFKYAKLYRDNPKKEHKRPQTNSIEATQSFEWLHIDIMHIQTQEDGIQKVAFVKDNYSKAILNHASTDGKAGSEFIRNLLEDTYISYGLRNLTHDINLVTDGGSENKGLVLDWIDELDTPPAVRKLTAKTDEFPFTNNMAESTHRIFRMEFLHGRVPRNKAECDKWIEEFVHYYSHQRYPTDHLGLTVMEVLNGIKPDKDKYKHEKELARQNRYETNIKFEDCPFVSGFSF